MEAACSATEARSARSLGATQVLAVLFADHGYFREGFGEGLADHRLRGKVGDRYRALVLLLECFGSNEVGLDLATHHRSRACGVDGYGDSALEIDCHGGAYRGDEPRMPER